MEKKNHTVERILKEDEFVTESLSYTFNTPKVSFNMSIRYQEIKIQKWKDSTTKIIQRRRVNKLQCKSKFWRDSSPECLHPTSDIRTEREILSYVFEIRTVIITTSYRSEVRKQMRIGSKKILSRSVESSLRTQMDLTER